ncbi:unnamed protein product [Owenia fusiformis]|uniref:Uncharacterized protein n=1 Tax=Owenia fusiformis TaxID=6347 RepID=A0A8S4PCT7_OWEFU|nr:unnamed protein product [Owenia fusiformis]
MAYWRYIVFLCGVFIKNTVSLTTPYNNQSEHALNSTETPSPTEESVTTIMDSNTIEDHDTTESSATIQESTILTTSNTTTENTTTQTTTQTTTTQTSTTPTTTTQSTTTKTSTTPTSTTSTTTTPTTTTPTTTTQSTTTQTSTTPTSTTSTTTTPTTTTPTTTTQSTTTQTSTTPTSTTSMTTTPTTTTSTTTTQRTTRRGINMSVYFPAIRNFLDFVCRLDVTLRCPRFDKGIFSHWARNEDKCDMMPDVHKCCFGFISDNETMESLAMCHDECNELDVDLLSKPRCRDHGQLRNKQR